MNADVVVESIDLDRVETVMGAGNSYTQRPYTVTQYNAQVMLYRLSRDDIDRLLVALRDADIGIEVRFT